MIEAFPLQWPTAWPRTETVRTAQFKVTMGEAVSHLYDELDRLGASDVVVSSNMRVRLDGRPYADQRRVDDESVAVYFKLNGDEQCIPCDKWSSTKDNVRAIGLTVQALRGLERWGAKDMVNAAFRGFKALPQAIVTPPPDRVKRDWWVVLGTTSDAQTHDVKRAYRQALSISHPDAGGTNEDFQEVQAAYEEWKRS